MRVSLLAVGLAVRTCDNVCMKEVNAGYVCMPVRVTIVVYACCYIVFALNVCLLAGEHMFRIPAW